jgi:hypothetical protein
MSSTDTPQSQLTILAFASQESIKQIQTVFPDILSWPESWMGDEDDLPAGNLVLGVFTQYLTHLMDKGRVRSTIRKHGDYLWALGGEIIRDTSDSGFDQSLSAHDLVLVYVDELGGSYWRHASGEEDHRQYDSVCRSLYRFLNLARSNL